MVPTHFILLIEQLAEVTPAYPPLIPIAHRIKSIPLSLAHTNYSVCSQSLLLACCILYLPGPRPLSSL